MGRNPDGTCSPSRARVAFKSLLHSTLYQAARRGGAIRTEPALSRQEQVALPPPPARNGVYEPSNQTVQGHSLNIAKERVQPRSHLNPLPCQNVRRTHTYKLFFLILCAQEGAVRGTHLRLSYTQPTPLSVCTEATLPNCTVVACLPS